MNAKVIIDLILALTSSLQAAATLINKARAENRDVTDEEMKSLMADNDLARARLVVAIANAKTREGG